MIMTTETLNSATSQGTHRAINPWTWQDQLGYSQALLVNQPKQTLYVAGQCAIDANGAPVSPGDMAGQVAQVTDNIETVLAAAGMTFGDVVRYDVYTTDLNAYFGAAGILVARLAAAGNIPAGGICTQVQSLALPGLMVEVTVTAAR